MVKAGDRIKYHVDAGEARDMVVRLLPPDAAVDFVVTPSDEKIKLPAKLPASSQTYDARCVHFDPLRYGTNRYIVTVETQKDTRYTLSVDLQIKNFTKKCPPDAYASPDGALVALNNACGEPQSEIQVWSSKKAPLYRQECPQVREGQGWGVISAAWTPDSKFFVFSTSSSGGHGPWHSPTYAYSRQDNKIFSLDDRIGAVGSEKFTLKTPDVVEVALYDFSTADTKPFSGKLSDIQRLPIKKSGN